MKTPTLREQALAAYGLGPEAVVALVGGLVARLGEQLERVMARVTAVEAENAALRAHLGRILVSRSWRLTAPLRAVIAKSRRLWP